MKKQHKHKAHIILFCMVVFPVFLGKAQELPFYIQEALKNNDELKAWQHKNKIAEEQINQATALPNTTFGFGYFVSEPETRTGAQKARLSVQQMIPWFGTLTARKNYAASLAETAFVEVVLIKRKLVLSVSLTYYELLILHNKQKLLKENIQLLQTYEQLAIASIETASSSAVDVLKLQIQQNELEAQLQLLEAEFNTTQTKFWELVNNNSIVSPAFPETLELPDAATNITPETITIHPELQKYEKLSESIENSLAVTKKESAPNLSFGLDYIAVQERANQDFSDNGKDIFMPMVSVSIPLFNNTYKSKVRELNLKKKEISAFQTAHKTKLETFLFEALQNRKTALVTYRTQVKNLERAKDAEEIIVKSFESENINFTQVLDIKKMQLALHEKRLNAIEAYFKAVAKINYLTKEKIM